MITLSVPRRLAAKLCAYLDALFHPIYQTLSANALHLINSLSTAVQRVS
jgi:hypothetical protein